jgi:hypothetical protein
MVMIHLRKRMAPKGRIRKRRKMNRRSRRLLKIYLKKSKVLWYKIRVEKR